MYDNLSKVEWPRQATIETIKSSDGSKLANVLALIDLEQIDFLRM